MSTKYQRQVILAVAFPSIAVALLNGLWVEPLHRFNPALFWAADLAHFVVIPFISVVLLGKLGCVWPKDYGFRSLASEYSPAAIIGLLVFISFLFWLFYYPVRDIAYRLFWQSAGDFGYGKMVPSGGLSKLLVVGYFALTAAVVEEVLFRSLPWLYFSLRYPGKRFLAAYTFITSVLFAAIHWEQGPHGVLAAFSLGLIAAFMYSRLLNVWPFVVAHLIADLVAFG